MKKYILAFMLAVLLAFVVGFTANDGHPILPRYTATPGQRWISIGTITASNATLAVDARDYSAVWTDLPDANTIKWTAPNDASGVEWRFQTTANADAHVIEHWVAAGDTYDDRTTEDSFMLAGTFTLTGG